MRNTPPEILKCETVDVQSQRSLVVMSGSGEYLLEVERRCLHIYTVIASVGNSCLKATTMQSQMHHCFSAIVVEQAELGFREAHQPRGGNSACLALIVKSPHCLLFVLSKVCTNKYETINCRPRSLQAIVLGALQYWFVDVFENSPWALVLHIQEFQVMSSGAVVVPSPIISAVEPVRSAGYYNQTPTSLSNFPWT